MTPCFIGGKKCRRIRVGSLLEHPGHQLSNLIKSMPLFSHSYIGSCCLFLKVQKYVPRTFQNLTSQCPAVSSVTYFPERPREQGASSADIRVKLQWLIVSAPFSTRPPSWADSTSRCMQSSSLLNLFTSFIIILAHIMQAVCNLP